MNWKFWTWGRKQWTTEELKAAAVKLALDSLQTKPLTQAPAAKAAVRTGFVFGVELTQEEQRAIAAAFEVAGERLEDQPQFGAVVLLAEQMFRLSHDAITGGAIGEVNDAALREQVAYQRALRDLVGQLRMAWDKARPKS